MRVFDGCELSARSEAGPLPAEILVAARKRVRLTTPGRDPSASPCLEAIALAEGEYGRLGAGLVEGDLEVPSQTPSCWRTSWYSQPSRTFRLDRRRHLLTSPKASASSSTRKAICRRTRAGKAAPRLHARRAARDVRLARRTERRCWRQRGQGRRSRARSTSHRRAPSG
jgi:hypothetical protein